MLFISLLFAVCLAGPNEDNPWDDGEYGHFNEWRQTICEKNNTSLYKDLKKCNEVDAKEYRDVFKKCAKEAKKSTKGDYAKFLKAACNDTDLYFKLDKCIDELIEKDPKLLEKFALTTKAEECFKEVLEKYGLASLVPYLENYK